MALAKGSQEGFMAWGKIEAKKRWPKAVCRYVGWYLGSSVYRVYEEPGGRTLATETTARDAWCRAANRLDDK